MTEATEKSSQNAEIEQLEIKKRRLQAAIVARRAVLSVLVQEGKRLSALTAEARSRLRDAEGQLLTVCSQLSAQRRPE